MLLKWTAKIVDERVFKFIEDTYDYKVENYVLALKDLPDINYPIYTQVLTESGIVFVIYNKTFESEKIKTDGVFEAQKGDYVFLNAEVRGRKELGAFGVFKGIKSTGELVLRDEKRSLDIYLQPGKYDLTSIKLNKEAIEEYQKRKTKKERHFYDALFEEDKLIEFKSDKLSENYFKLATDNLSDFIEVDLDSNKTMYIERRKHKK